MSRIIKKPVTAITAIAVFSATIGAASAQTDLDAASEATVYESSAELESDASVAAVPAILVGAAGAVAGAFVVGFAVGFVKCLLKAETQTNDADVLVALDEAGLAEALLD